jgi:predicted GIY-YIG superfamily endonuclease
VSERTAVYRVFDIADTLLYIGIAKNFGRRWEHHASVQPWWPEVARQTVEWHPDRDTAEAIEKDAIKAEGPRYNKIHAVKPPRPPKPERPKIVVMLTTPSRYRSTSQVAALADTTRYTVEREIARGNLAAEKVGAHWVIGEAEAERWAAQYRPYAEQRDRPQQPPAS